MVLHSTHDLLGVQRDFAIAMVKYPGSGSVNKTVFSAVDDALVSCSSGGAEFFFHAVARDVSLAHRFCQFVVALCIAG